MSRDEFDKWVDVEANDALKVYENSSYVRIEINIRRKLVSIFNIRTGKLGLAKCRKTDTFSPNIGIAIAWSRYCNPEAEIPIIAERVSYEDVEVGDLIWYKSSIDGVYRKYMVEKKSVGAIGENPMYRAYTLDFDLVNEYLLCREHVTSLDSYIVPGLRKFWRVID